MSEVQGAEQDADGTRNAENERLVARLGYVTEAMRVWVWETDAEHRFTYMSPSVNRFSGRAPEWHYGRTREELGSVGVDDVEWEAFRHLLEQCRRFGPVEFRRVDGDCTYWIRTAGDPLFDSEGAFLGYRGVGCEFSDEMEIREGKSRTEGQVVEKLAMLSATIAAFPCAVSVFDGEQRLAFANADYYAIFDLPVGRFPAGTHLQLIFAYLAERGEFRGGEQRDLVDRHMAIIESGAPHSFQRTRPNGRRIEIKGVPLADGGFLRTYVDVTERIELQWRLDARNRDLTATLEALAVSQAEAAVLRQQLAARGDQAPGN